MVTCSIFKRGYFQEQAGLGTWCDVLRGGELPDKNKLQYEKSIKQSVDEYQGIYWPKRCNNKYKQQRWGRLDQRKQMFIS